MSINTTVAYKTSITIPYGGLQPAIEWCERNCKNEWGFSETEPPLGEPQALDYTFYFESERDYFAFIVWEK